MNISKNILQGVMLGLSTLTLASVHSELAAQQPLSICSKPPQQQDTVQVQPADEAETPRPVGEQDQVAQPGDATELIDKHPCITCGRG